MHNKNKLAFQYGIIVVPVTSVSAIVSNWYQPSVVPTAIPTTMDSIVLSTMYRRT